MHNFILKRDKNAIFINRAAKPSLDGPHENILLQINSYRCTLLQKKYEVDQGTLLPQHFAWFL